MSERVLIKKYANRRLYDTEKSRYITLTQVADMIREGTQVEVRDAKTKEDVTNFILTQIILEEVKNKNALLPSPVLHLIIQYGDNLLGEFFEKYFHPAIQNYIKARGMFEDQFKKWIDLSMDLSGIKTNPMKDNFQLKSFMDFFTNSGDEKKS
ncbi:MAG: transcriptional regulator [Deltaproteobacteria bacterium]|nr:MAG: transcriptional regulator [Deltaproteobacteria bacterium]